MSPIEVLSVASEIFPLVKTGGLADVTGALPGALAGEGIVMRSLVPGYPAVSAALPAAEPVHAFPELYGGPARIVAGRASGLDLLVLEAPHLYDRPGNPYLGPDGLDWPDNAFRFAALARAATTLARGAVAGLRFDIVHGHDWQAGLVPAYLHYEEGPRPATVMTVHNLAFQGRFPSVLLGALGLPPHAYAMYGVELYGSVGFLKAGLQYADRITTVSPTYAAEIRGPGAGMGLEGLLNARAAVLSGIANGIDDEIWNPATDPLIARHYDARRLGRRLANKEALERELGLPTGAGRLLFGVVSRLSWQKGLDVILDCLPTLIAEGASLALLGSGEPALEQRFRDAAAAAPERIACRFGYDERLAHRFQAGCDAMLVPSRFEPCGLTQLCAQRYGAIPVVARVGGLADTVIDANPAALARGIGTGIQFAPVAPEMLDFAIRRTAALWRDRPSWNRIQRNALAMDVSWRSSARHYARLYRELVNARPLDRAAGAPS